MQNIKNMKDYIVAIYKVETYAGESQLKLVKVLLDENIPQEFNNCHYVIKLMGLCEVKF